MRPIVTIQEETTKNPITLIGREAGECWGSNVKDTDMNYMRGLRCISSNHGRTLEFPQIYMKIEGYSARVIRELYTHIGGAPTRLQASTRYINYFEELDYVTPPLIEDDEEAVALYDQTIETIRQAAATLRDKYDIPNEDVAMLLPLGMTSTVVVRTNLRNLVDMSHQRLCSRAYWEFRKLMTNILTSLSEYSTEWGALVKMVNLFDPKCMILGYCPEEHSCGRMPKKEDL